jgi:hypothetical protein
MCEGERLFDIVEVKGSGHQVRERKRLTGAGKEIECGCQIGRRVIVD